MPSNFPLDKINMTCFFINIKVLCSFNAMIKIKS
jgi:hypothetical protein